VFYKIPSQKKVQRSQIWRTIGPGWLVTLCWLRCSNAASRHVPVGSVFQSDGAPPHFCHHFSAFLDRAFPDRWVGRGRLHSLTPSFSKFDSCWPFFWEFITDIAYSEEVQNVNELRNRTVRGVECVTSWFLGNSWHVFGFCHVLIQRRYLLWMKILHTTCLVCEHLRSKTQARNSCYVYSLYCHWTEDIFKFSLFRSLPSGP